MCPVYVPYDVSGVQLFNMPIFNGQVQFVNLSIALHRSLLTPDYSTLPFSVADELSTNDTPLSMINLTRSNVKFVLRCTTVPAPATLPRAMFISIMLRPCDDV